jgi:hypothetical protein
MLNDNIQNRPELIVPNSQLPPITNPLDSMVQGIDRTNQLAVDDYNANLRAALSAMGAEYEDAVEGINNQRLYQGRDDLLFFQTADLYNRYRIDAIQTPDGGVVAQDNITNPQVGNEVDRLKEEAQQPRATENQVLEYFEKYYPANTTPYNTLNDEDYNNLINHYINNPDLMNEPPQIPTNNEPVAKALKASGIQQAPSPAPTPAPTPAPALATQATIDTGTGTATIAPTNA